MIDGYLENINGPEDIKKLRRDQLQALADETRQALISKLSATGGHVGSNLGVVELTVALHYVFDSPRDKIVWDVSHQCYPHKILTGRKAAYTDPAHYREVTGFTNPKESEHDLFTIGHTATSIPLTLGLAKGRDVSGGRENIVELDCCITRLRVTVADGGKVSERLLKESGSRGILQSGAGVQVVYGSQVTVIKNELEEALNKAK